MMKKALYFYFLCCFWNILFHLVMGYIYSGIHDLMSGLQIAIIFVILLYAPLCTVLAYLYYKFKINSIVIKFPLLFSLPPFIISAFLQLNTKYSDYLLVGLFIAENILVMGFYVVKHLVKKKH